VDDEKSQIDLKKGPSMVGVPKRNVFKKLLKISYGPP
jgi:hypothetical protein